MEKIQTLTKKVLASLENMPRESKEYQDKFLALAPLCQSLYPQEFNSFLEKLGLKENLTEWKKKAQEMINEVDSFGLNFQENNIEVELSGEKLAMPLVDLNRFISLNLKLKAPTWEYMLVLSTLAQAETFELFQIANAIILAD